MKPLSMTVAVVAATMTIFASEVSADRAKMSIDDLTPTGETRNCIRPHDVRETMVIDKGTILFRSRAEDYYVNRLEAPCPGLKIDGRFGYTVRGTNQLCDTDSIKVVKTTGPSFGAVCPLGKFEHYTVKQDVVEADRTE